MGEAQVVSDGGEFLDLVCQGNSSQGLVKEGEAALVCSDVIKVLPLLRSRLDE